MKERKEKWKGKWKDDLKSSKVSKTCHARGDSLQSHTVYERKNIFAIFAMEGMELSDSEQDFNTSQSISTCSSYILSNAHFFFSRLL